MQSTQYSYFNYCCCYDAYFTERICMIHSGGAQDIVSSRSNQPFQQMKVEEKGALFQVYQYPVLFCCPLSCCCFTKRHSGFKLYVLYVFFNHANIHCSNQQLRGIFQDCHSSSSKQTKIKAKQLYLSAIVGTLRTQAIYYSIMRNILEEIQDYFQQNTEIKQPFKMSQNKKQYNQQQFDQKWKCKLCSLSVRKDNRYLGLCLMKGFIIEYTIYFGDKPYYKTEINGIENCRTEVPKCICCSFYYDITTKQGEVHIGKSIPKYKCCCFCPHVLVQNRHGNLEYKLQRTCCPWPFVQYIWCCDMIWEINDAHGNNVGKVNFKHCPQCPGCQGMYLTDMQMPTSADPQKKQLIAACMPAMINL